MNLDELKIFRDPTVPTSPQSEQVPAAGGQASSHLASESYQEKQGEFPASFVNSAQRWAHSSYLNYTKVILVIINVH